MKKRELRDKLYAENIPVYSGNKIKKADAQKILATLEITGSSITLDFVKKVIDFLVNKIKTAGVKKPNMEKFNTYVKQQASANVLEFAKAAVDFFKADKLSWEGELSVLQDKYNPKGFEIIPASWLERQFSGEPYEIQKRLPQLLQKKK